MTDASKLAYLMLPPSEVIAMIDQIKEENARLRDALEFYADDTNWYSFGNDPDAYRTIEEDTGTIAKKALGK